jgi:hypothetical protein
MDHSLLGGRRIRIERTAGGGGKKPRRLGRITRARGHQEGARRGEVLAYLNKTLERLEAHRIADHHADDLAADGRLHSSRVRPAAVSSAAPARPLRREDVDELVLQFLCTLPRDVMRSSVRGAARVDLAGVESPPAYLMGLIKRRLRRGERKAKRLRRAASLGRMTTAADNAAGPGAGSKGPEIHDSGEG